jgi:hypothetical protein
MDRHRIKITYAPHVPLEEVELACESGFGGFGNVFRGAQERVLILHDLRVPYDIVSAQLTVLQNHGELSWEVTT